MTNAQKEQFINMATELSPEWLSCDGELGFNEIMRKRQEIMTRWHALESEVGKLVTEDEAWDFQLEKRSKKVAVDT